MSRSIVAIQVRAPDGGPVLLRWAAPSFDGWTEAQWNDGAGRDPEAAAAIRTSVEGPPVHVDVWGAAGGGAGEGPISVALGGCRGSFFTARVRVDEGASFHLWQDAPKPPHAHEDHRLGIGAWAGRGSEAGLHRLPGHADAWEWSLSDSVGETSIGFAGRYLPVLVLDRKMPGASPDARIGLLETLLHDVWSRHVALVRRLGRAPEIGLARGRRSRSPLQTLMLLDRLVHAGGVSEAWDETAHEPRRALVISRPVRPIERAARPILHGHRGPWALPRGMDQDGEPVRVRDRRPRRTTDVPANRLALRLAVVIEEHASDLAELLAASDREGSGQSLDGWHSRAGHLAALARELRAAPALAEVDPWDPLQPDAPSLALDPRCRPLLRAWAELQEGVDFRREADHLFRDPLKEAYDLYEYWCWFALCKSVENAGPGPGKAGRVELAKERPLSREAELRWALKCDVDLGDGRTARLWYNKPAAEGAFVSYSIAFRPDLALEVLKDGRAADLVLFDAKYRVDVGEAFVAPTTVEQEREERRRIRVGQGKNDDLKVMHAYRDAVRWTDAEGVRRPPRWVLALFPGTEMRIFPTAGDTGRPLRNPHALSAPSGGVGCVPVSPGSPDVLPRVIQALLTRTAP